MEDSMAQRWYDFILAEDEYEDENAVKDPLMVGLHNLYGIDSHRLYRGSPIADWSPDSWLRSRSKNSDGPATDVLVEPFDVPILSKRLRECLDSSVLFPGEVQWLSIHVYRSTGEEVPGYSIANVLKPVRALDRARSFMLDEDPEDVDADTGLPHVRGVARPALVGKALANRTIVRLEELFSSLFVSEALVNAYRKGKFTGGYFPEVLVT